MRRMLLWVSLTFAANLFAQNAIPPGTILPVSLRCSLNSRKLKPGQIVAARVMQDVPLADGSTIRAGARVTGHVTGVKPATGAVGGEVSFRFDTLVISKRQMPIPTNVRALASAMAVEDAQVPESGPDRGTAQEAWTTNQIGGEVVYRGGGPVANGLRSVGEPAYGGVLVHGFRQTWQRMSGRDRGQPSPSGIVAVFFRCLRDIRFCGPDDRPCGAEYSVGRDYVGIGPRRR
jgi:hypothetical protein